MRIIFREIQKIRHFVGLLIAFVMLAALTGKASADVFPIADGSRILWIGNSLTRYLYEYVDDALQSGIPLVGTRWHADLCMGLPLQAQYENSGSYNNYNTLVGEGIYADWPTSWINAVDAIQNGHPDGQPWDYVVLQGFSNDMSDDPSLFFEYVRKFDLVIRMHGAETVLYMRWATNPDTVGFDSFLVMTSHLEQHYTNMGREIGAPVAPIALMWRNLLTRTDNLFEVSDFFVDTYHQSGVSMGINAYAFYSILLRRSPIGLDFEYGNYNVSYVENRTGETFATVDSAIEQEVRDVISQRENWDDPGYVEPASSGGASVSYESQTGRIEVTILGSITGLRIGCPKKDYIDTSKSPAINGQSPDFMDSEIIVWYREEGFAPGIYDLDTIVPAGFPIDEIGFAYTPMTGCAKGGGVQPFQEPTSIRIQWDKLP